MARGSGSSDTPSFAARPAPRAAPAARPALVKTYTVPMSGRQTLPNGTLANPRKADITNALKQGAITRAEAQEAWKRAISCRRDTRTHAHTHTRTHTRTQTHARARVRAYF
jgi:hypothetical protein